MIHNEITENEIEVSVSGDIQKETVAHLRDFLLEEIKNHHQIVSINFSNASIHCSTKLFTVMLIIRKRLADQNRILKIRGCGNDFYEQCHLLKLDKIISIEK